MIIVQSNDEIDNINNAYMFDINDNDVAYFYEYFFVKRN